MSPAPPLPAVIGHRGAAGSAPENTLAALRRAKALGCRWVEFDVRLTGDGALILLHDERIDRTTDGTGKAAALTLAAISRRDAGRWFARAFAGERVPTLEDAMATLNELGLGANIELKSTQAKAAETGAHAAEALHRLWPSHLPPPLISSFLTPALAAARDRAPDLPRGLLFRGIPKNWRSLAESLECTTIHADCRRLRRTDVEEIRRSGYPLLAYTVNNVARARRLFDWGVTSVFSDVPEIILTQAARDGARQVSVPA